MKNFYRIFTLLVVCFVVGCTDSIYDSIVTPVTTVRDDTPKTSLTINNQSSFDLQDFIWNGKRLDISKPLTKGSSITLYDV